MPWEIICKWALCFSDDSSFHREDPDLKWKSSQSFLVLGREGHFDQGQKQSQISGLGPLYPSAAKQLLTRSPCSPDCYVSVCVVSGKSLVQINVQIWQGKCTSRTSTVWAHSASSTLGSCPTPSWLMSSMRNSRWVFGFPLWLLGGTPGWAKENFNTNITIIKLTRWLTLS